MSQIEASLILLVATTLIVPIARRFNLPYPILLVLGGLALSFVPEIPPIALKPEYVLVLILPPILQSAAFFTPVRDLRAQIRPILSLAFGLVIATTCVVAVVAHLVVDGLSWPAAFVLGAIVSPPDAVAATTIAERLNLPRRLVTILEGESLLNDATALVTYRVAVAATVTGAFALDEAVIEFAEATVGGLIVGVLAGLIVVRLLLMTRDGSVLIATSLLAPYATYLIAEHLDFSGVLAVVIEGLMMGRVYFRLESARHRMQSLAFWEMFIFLLNGFVFILVGFQLDDVLDGVSHLDGTTLFWYAAVISLTAILIRMLWVFITSDPIALGRRNGLSCSRSAERRDLVVVMWAGMRGAVSLAAALGLPADLPHRNLLVFLTFAVMLATLVGQGLTLAPLIKRLHIDGDRGEWQEELETRIATARAARTRLDELAREEWVRKDVVQDLAGHIDQRLTRLDARRDGARDADAQEAAAAAFARLQIELLDAEIREATRLRDAGRINDGTLRTIQRELDVERVRLERI